MNPVASGWSDFTWHYAIEDDHILSWKVSNLMPFPWNFRRQTIEPYLTDWKNDSKQLDEIKANWNQATDSKKQWHNNVNAFHDNERTYAIQSRHNSSAK